MLPVIILVKSESEPLYYVEFVWTTVGIDCSTFEALMLLCLISYQKR